MKRFELEQVFAPYTDYTSVRDNDSIRRITLVEGGLPYITYECADDADPRQEEVSIDDAMGLLEQELN